MAKPQWRSPNGGAPIREEAKRRWENPSVKMSIEVDRRLSLIMKVFEKTELNEVLLSEEKYR